MQQKNGQKINETAGRNKIFELLVEAKELTVHTEAVEKAIAAVSEKSNQVNETLNTLSQSDLCKYKMNLILEQLNNALTVLKETKTAAEGAKKLQNELSAKLELEKIETKNRHKDEPQQVIKKTGE